ncbi:uncharacterized protein si:ch211-106h4.12 isoform X1 [Rhinichthys klamathensis goyatoka]|uniref:uncharacterized protein si:ch211-106h4.12 isoform X1 n=1 Tax=Rhinichthys klamathensis goyatoka TaxID=3034132 RepID=UPI0024B56E4A|nr:uncharacterized protein si:ch211-106h4.12 isoform X1 [Rhinichthys klamathensis goyatoka]
MKCTWTAESSRMKGSVQLGLLCFGLLISSLHGEVETDNSMELVLNLEEPDLYQPEMNRVRRQTVSTEKEDSAKKEVVVPSSVDGKIKRGKRPRPGAFTLSEDDKYSELKVYRTKRQNKSKNKPKKRPGFNSLLGKGPQLHMVFSIL